MTSATDYLFLDTLPDWRRFCRSATFRSYIARTITGAETEYGLGNVRVITRAAQDRWLVYLEPAHGHPSGRELVAAIDRETLDDAMGGGNASGIVFDGQETRAVAAAVWVAPGSVDCGMAIIELERRGEDVEALAQRVRDLIPNALPRRHAELLLKHARGRGAFHVEPGEPHAEAVLDRPIDELEAEGSDTGWTPEHRVEEPKAGE